MDYITQLRRARERAGFQSPELEVLEKNTAPVSNKREGLMSRPQAAPTPTQPSRNKQEQIWADIGAWSASLGEKRKAALKPSTAPVPEEKNPTAPLDEKLGVKQEEFSPDAIAEIQASLNQVAATANTIKANIPGDVKEDKMFMSEVNRLAGKYRVSPDALLGLMSFESGFNPAARNKDSSATGLIQFLPSTAKSLGTTVEKLAGMSRPQQMKYVEKYLDQFGLDGPSDKDLYMAVLYPKAIGKADDFALFTEGSRAYEQNKGLDRNKDGKVTKAEAASKVFGTGGVA
jgi:hypothetical protein